MTKAKTTLDPYAGWTDTERAAVTPEALKLLEGNPDLPMIREALRRLEAAPAYHAVTEQIKAAQTPAEYRAAAEHLTGTHRQWLIEAAGKLEQDRRSRDAFTVVNLLIDERQRALAGALSYRPQILQPAAPPPVENRMQNSMRHYLDAWEDKMRRENSAKHPTESIR